MERTWGSVRPGLSAQLRTPGLCLGLWPAWRTVGQAPGALARLTDIWTGAWGFWLAWRTLGRRLGLWLAWRTLGQAPGALARLADTWTGAWGSGSVFLEKVPAFFYFAGTFFDAKPIEAHRGSFHCAIWLDAGTFSNRISYRPANKLTSSSPRTSLLALIREQAYSHCPVREMSLWQSSTTK